MKKGAVIAWLAGLVVLSVCICITLIWGDFRDPLSTKPALEDIGTPVDGSVVCRTVTLKNTGRRALTIVDVVRQCGCQSVSLGKKILEAGEETHLRVDIRANKVNTNNFFSQICPDSRHLSRLFLERLQSNDIHYRTTANLMERKIGVRIDLANSCVNCDAFILLSELPNLICN